MAITDLSVSIESMTFLILREDCPESILHLPLFSSANVSYTLFPTTGTLCILKYALFQVLHSFGNTVLGVRVRTDVFEHYAGRVYSRSPRTGA